MRGFSVLSVCLLLVFGAGTAAAKCPKGKVRVRAKTPLRNGPGLNYPVRKFFERRRCGRMEQVSADGQWALMRFGKRMGWVLVKRLDDRGQARARALPARKNLPAGSGKARRFYAIGARAVLRERPQDGAPPRRVLPAEARVLPLRRTRDGTWIEVRDDRGDVGWVSAKTLPEIPPDLPEASVGEALPVLTGETPVVSTPGEEAPTLVLRGASLSPSRRQIGGRRDGVHVSAAVFGGVAFPGQRLDSDAISGLRRYSLSSASVGLGVELQVTDLGPLTVRAGGFFGTLEGLKAEDDEGAAGGSSTSIELRAGWPLRVGPVTLSPEIGYALDALSLDLALPGARTTTFVSSESHAGLLGIRGQWPLGDLLIELEAAFSVGSLAPRPGTLGTDVGVALGGRGAVDLHYLFDASFGVLFRYAIDGREVAFSGPSTLDGSISQAQLTELRQALLLGASVSF